MLWEASQQGRFQPSVHLGFLGLDCMKDKRISDAESNLGGVLYLWEHRVKCLRVEKSFYDLSSPAIVECWLASF